ncbi:hypothetical protein lerEdw1_012705 [Lerista edwardsae]|nr:hypothetical protein lerEdw1_012705 [Lerista edwardsae]
MVCLKQVCENYEVLHYDCNPEKQCSGHGVCNNNKNCHCNPGWSPPNCKEKGDHLGGSIDSGILTTKIDIAGKAAKKTKRTWILLSLCLFLPIALGSAILFAKRHRLRKYCMQDEDLSFTDTDSYTTSETRSMSERGRSLSLSDEGSITDKEA